MKAHNEIIYDWNKNRLWQKKLKLRARYDDVVYKINMIELRHGGICSGGCSCDDCTLKKTCVYRHSFDWYRCQKLYQRKQELKGKIKKLQHRLER